MTFSALWTFLAVALPVLGALLANLPSVDLAYHLRAGGMALDSGTIPTHDTFTFTAAGAPWLNQQWGAQLILAAVYRVGGWTGLVVLRAVLVGLLFTVVLAICLRAGLSRRVAAWLTLAAFLVSAVALALRPQLFGMLLFAIVVYLVVDRRVHPNRLWLVVPIVVIWANLHGSFFLGPLVVGLAWIADVHDRVPGARGTVAIALVAALAASLNPSGAAVWLYAAGVTTNPLISARITEWQPTSVLSVSGILFFGSALVVAGIAAHGARRGRRVPWPALVWLAVFFGIGIYATRGVAWWPIAAVAVIAPILASDGAAVPGAAPAPARGTPGRRELPRRPNLAIAGALVLGAIALLPLWRPLDAGLAAPMGVVGFAPSGISGALRTTATPGDRLLNPQPWGSWFELAFPQLPVAIDSRIEVFPARVWDDYETVSTAGPGWATILDGWGVTMIVATPSQDAALVGALSADRGWRRAYSDADGLLFVRSDRPG
jgi:hypothetical protein